MVIESASLVGLVGLGCTLTATFIGFSNYTKSNKKDLKSDMAGNIRLEAKLDYVGRGVDDIKLDMKEQNKKFDTINDRLARNEEQNRATREMLERHIEATCPQPVEIIKEV